jgi:hypothetical protein
MTLEQFALSFWLGGSVAYWFGTLSGLKIAGVLREHPIVSLLFLTATSLLWPIFAIRTVVVAEEGSK